VIKFSTVVSDLLVITENIKMQVVFNFALIVSDILLYNLSKVNVKFSLCFNQEPHNEGVLGKWRYSSMHS
jgi:hypothetical protein